MTSDDGSMKQFNDCVSGRIDNSGGRTTANIHRIVEKAREVTPEFSVQRLLALLGGLPPSVGDRRAVSYALVPMEDQWLCEYFLLEDEESRRIAKSAERYSEPHRKSVASRRGFAIKFVQSGIGHSNFRDVNLAQEDLSKAMDEFLSTTQLDDQLELFGLDKDSK